MDKYISAGRAQDIQNYDCRPFEYSADQLQDRGSASTVLGAAFITYGIIAEVCYVVAMIAMLHRDLRSLSCYKIMIVLGIYDMLAIGVNSILTGYLWLVGGWYCTQPDLIYVSGAFGLGLWCGACMNCFVLVVNRLIDLWKPHLMGTFFRGNRTLIILLIPLVYSIYFAMWTPPLIFNSEKTAWFFDPFVTDNENETFYNYPHTVNNLLIVVATCALYSFVVAVLMKMFNQGGGRRVTNNQLSIIFQSTAICMANLIAALIYVYMQFFATPKWLILIGHMSWQAGHGIPAFVYLLMNKTIQHELRRVFLGARKNKITAQHRYGDTSDSRTVTKTQQKSVRY